MKNRKNNKGFSLVELIVVVAIMAVLVGVLAPAYLKYVEKTRLQKDNSGITEVCAALQNATADEECYNEIGTDVETVATISKTGIVYTAANTNIAAELESVVPAASLKLASKAYASASIEVQAISVNGNVQIYVKGFVDDAGDTATTGYAAQNANGLYPSGLTTTK